MSPFRMVWRDIKARRNIELYLTLAVCLLVLAGDIAGLPLGDTPSEAILATLALLAYSTLVTRRSDEQIERKLDALTSNVSSRLLQKWSVEEFETHLATATEVCFVSVANYNLIAEYAEQLKDLVRRGGRLRCIYVKPTDSLSRMALERAFGKERPEHSHMYMRLTIEKLGEIAECCADGENVQARLIDNLNTSPKSLGR